MIPVPVKVVQLDPNLPLPEYKSVGASGMDVCSVTDVYIKPGQRVMLPVGIKVAIPPGFEIQVRPRSGLAWNDGLTVLNTPGTIDSDYRGELAVILINHSTEPRSIARRERIAQIVVCPVFRIEWHPVTELTDTLRGEGGFGSTGVTETIDYPPGTLRYKKDDTWRFCSPHDPLYSTVTMLATECWDCVTKTWRPIDGTDEAEAVYPQGTSHPGVLF